MATTDYRILGNLKSAASFRNEAEARDLDRQVKEAAIMKAQADAAAGPELPSNIREYQLIQQLPQEQQRAYYDFLKAKSPNYGGEFTLPTPMPAPQSAPQPAPQPAKPPQITGGFVPPGVQPPLPDFSMPPQAPGKATPLSIPVINEKIDQAPIMPQVSNATPVKAPQPVFLRNARGEYDTRNAGAGMAWADVNGERVLAPVPTAGSKGGSVVPKELAKIENDLRGEYNQLTKDFRSVQDAWAKISTVSETPAGDLSLVYATAKLNDPGSVVREQDFILQAKAGSYGDRLQNMVTSLTSGQRLTAEQRANLKNEAKLQYEAQLAGKQQIDKFYTDTAMSYGAEPKRVIADYARPVGTPKGEKERAAFDARKAAKQPIKFLGFE